MSGVQLTGHGGPEKLVWSDTIPVPQPGPGQVLVRVAAAGVNNTDELLKVGATPQGRKDLAEKTGISDKLILEWVNLADLMRINGIGPQFSELLEAAGVDHCFSGDRADGTTGKCLVLITPDAERSMNTFLGISETLSTDQLDEAAIAASEYLYIEGYLVSSETGRAAAIRAERSRLTISGAGAG